MTAAAVLLMSGVVLTGCRKSQVAVAVSATDDTSQFVTLTDVVPDAILEIRYFGPVDPSGCRQPACRE